MEWDTVIKELAEVKTLLNNHLKHHELWFRSVIAPMGVAVIVILVKILFFMG